MDLVCEGETPVFFPQPVVAHCQVSGHRLESLNTFVLSRRFPFPEI